MTDFGLQCKHVVRRLMRTPLFTAMTLFTLAIGIGANTAIFSVIESVLLKPLPYAHPDELVGIRHTAPGWNMTSLNAAASLYFVYRDENRTFQDIGLWNGESVSVTGVGDPEQVQSLQVTEGTLPLLGIHPSLGRGFSHEDDSPASPKTILLTYGYWQSRFGGDRAVIGRRILVDGIAREVIGVLPQSFRFLDQKPSLVTPFQFDRAKLFWGGFNYHAVGRLKPGVTLEQASADVARILPIYDRRVPPPPGFSLKLIEAARVGASVRPFKQDLVGDIGNMLWVLMGSIGMVLLIACANVANLLLVRAEGRQQELAIRAALGAGSRQIARELLLESVTLGLAGGVLGLVLAYWALVALVWVAPANLPRIEDISIDPNALLFTLTISLLAGILFGLIPVFKYVGPNLATSLRSGGRSSSQSRERHRAKSALVVIQVALALVLLVSSGLMIRTFQAMRNVQPGFSKPEELQTLSIFIPPVQVKDELPVLRMQQAILEKIGNVPGVSSAAMVNVLPMDGQGWNNQIFVKDQPDAEGKLSPLRRFKFASPRLFQTMANRLVAGRDFEWTDSYNLQNVAIVSENLARELWGNPSSALGKQVRETQDGPWREVVGVVEDERDDGLNKKAPAIIYMPTLVKNFEGSAILVQRSMSFVVRSKRAGSEAFVNELRQAVWAVNSNVPVADVGTLAMLYNKSLARTSFTLTMLAIAGCMALLLGVIGIYGVISYSVSQRTREIGIRMAIGASPLELTQMFVRHGLMLAGIGVICGLTAAILLSRLLTKLLFEVSPVDPLTYGMVAIGLAGAATLASYLPARRASTIDPLEALRLEY